VRKTSKTLFAGLAVLGLLASACSEDDGSGSGSTEAPSSEAPSSEAPSTDAPSGDLPVLQTSIDTGLAYTGGPGGEASGDPIKIGYVNQEEGTPSWPESTLGADAGVWFANTFLGGVGGRPIELVKCFISKEEDGQKCGQELLADEGVFAVLVGAAVVGNQPLMDTLKDKKPVFVANPLTVPEFVATDGFAFTPGVPGVIGGLAIFAGKYLPEIEGKEVKSAAVVYNTNPAGVGAFESFTKPVLEKMGITVTGVPVADAAGPTEMATAIQASGADTADVFIPLVQVQGCIGVYEAIKTLEIDTSVVTTGLCFGVPMQEHLAAQGVEGKLPDGWYFGAYGYSYEIPGNPEQDAYIDVVLAWAKLQGIENPNYTGFGGPTFGTLMTMLQFLNGGAADGDGLRAAARAFTGPMWAVAGKMACGASVPFTGLCGGNIGVQQQQGTEFVSILDGYNGKDFDAAAEIAALG